MQFFPFKKKGGYIQWNILIYHEKYIHVFIDILFQTNDKFLKWTETEKGSEELASNNMK